MLMTKKTTKRVDVTRIDITYASLFRVLVVVLGLLAVMRLRNLIVYLLFSLLFAVALHPLVRRMERWGLQRGLALAVVLMLVVGGATVLLWVTVRSLTDTVVEFVREAPAYLAELEQNDTLQPVAKELRQYFEELDAGGLVQNGISRSGSVVTSVSRVFEAALFTFFFTVYMLLEHAYLIKIVRALVPKHWEDELNDVMNESTHAIGGYIRGQTVASILIGVMSYIIFRILGVPNALALAIIIGATDIIPVVGGLLGLVPATLIALTVSPYSAILVIVLVQIYSTINNNIVKPRLYGESVDISPFIIFLTTTIGVTLFGLVGVIMALPVAAVTGFILTKYKGIPIIVEEGSGS